MARPAPLPPSVEPPTWAPPDTRAAWSCQSAAAQPRDVSSTIVSPEAWGDTYMAHLRQACPDFVKAEQAFESGHLRGPEECHLDEAHSPLVLAARNADGSPKPGLAAFALCVQGRPLHVGCSDKCMNCAVPRPLLRSSCPYLFTAHIPPHLLIMADAAMRGVGSPAHASLGSALGCAAEMAASTQEVMSSTLPCSKLFVHPVTGRVMANLHNPAMEYTFSKASPALERFEAPGAPLSRPSAEVPSTSTSAAPRPTEADPGGIDVDQLRHTNHAFIVALGQRCSSITVVQRTRAPGLSQGV